MPPRRKRLEGQTEPVKSPQELRLYPSRRSWSLMLLGCLVFCGMSFVVIERNPWAGWAGFGMFGLGVVVSLLLLLFPGVSCLRLTAEGFHIGSPFRTSFTRWQDVAYSGVASISFNSVVVFNYSPSYTGLRLGRQLAFDLVGWEGALNDTYGMSAQELADLMNEWKRRSTQTDSGVQR